VFGENAERAALEVFRRVQLRQFPIIGKLGVYFGAELAQRSNDTDLQFSSNGWKCCNKSFFGRFGFQTLENTTDKLRKFRIRQLRCKDRNTDIRGAVAQHAAGILFAFEGGFR